jgi:hypothetical protein
VGGAGCSSRLLHNGNWLRPALYGAPVMLSLCVCGPLQQLCPAAHWSEDQGQLHTPVMWERPAGAGLGRRMTGGQGVLAGGWLRQGGQGGASCTPFREAPAVHLSGRRQLAAWGDARQVAGLATCFRGCSKGGFAVGVWVMCQVCMSYVGAQLFAPMPCLEEPTHADPCPVIRCCTGCAKWGAPGVAGCQKEQHRCGRMVQRRLSVPCCAGLWGLCGRTLSSRWLLLGRGGVLPVLTLPLCHTFLVCCAVCPPLGVTLASKSGWC